MPSFSYFTVPKSWYGRISKAFRLLKAPIKYPNFSSEMLSLTFRIPSDAVSGSSYDIEITEYSFIDSNNWKKIGKEMKGGIQYHIIAGIQEVGIWEYNAVQKRITKICSIDWKGILKENETII